MGKAQSGQAAALLDICLPHSGHLISAILFSFTLNLIVTSPNVIATDAVFKRPDKGRRARPAR